MLDTKYKSSYKSKKRRHQDKLDKICADANTFLQTNCSDLIKNFDSISLLASTKTDDELQILYNDNQTKMLERIKNTIKFDQISEEDSELSCGEKNLIKRRKL